ncbi:uncharacterized protein LOC123868313 [Maniola jurtina]|uniref:uncharacterized protein LOC123868313 n=1 Tax=Maniola jurtina TaxID=191418 RepID=UPI001E68E788|nr:uncharacterized protein LOC123868313 [Maniola jurtina]
MASKDFEKFIRKETLISLVEKRPVLWDKTLDIYRDKVAKAAAWREICVTLMEDYEKLEQTERQEFGKFVTKKWAQTRDSWIRTLNEKKKAKKSGASVKSYRYHKQMLFLKKVVCPDTHERVSSTKTICYKDSTPSMKEIHKINEEDSDSQEESQYTRHNSTQPTPRSAVKRKLADEDEKMISYIDQHLKPKAAEHEDRHLSFFKSLLPSLALLNDDQTLEFQSRVISLIQNIKKTRTGQSICDWSSPQTSSCNHYQSQDPFNRPHAVYAQAASLASSGDSVKSEPAESVESE